VTLSAGTRLGPFEITGRLGEGGMGEVYRATDTRLRREVAIKVLPPAFIEDRERLARFEREAQLLAQLHHPNIASIFGIEEAGGTRALVMELVEGPTLAERLANGALPLDETLAIARQIAEALEAAHEKGIVHRDLKPQNIKASLDGMVKVLDFGLAKAMDAAVSASPADPARSPTLMNSPTLTAAGTALGVILGTAAYMAPEQAKGRAVDRRADIWAFGVILWEMLAGRQLFAADTVAETLGYVMTREPDPAQLPRTTPAALRALVARCLVRDPRHRLQAIGDARIALEEIAARPQAETVSEGRRRAVSPLALAGAVAAGIAATVGILALGGWLHRGKAAAGAPGAAGTPHRAEILGLSIVDSSNVAISPDGTEVAGYDMTPSKPALLRRALNSFEVRAIPGSDSAFNPFYSPDGRSIGFFSNGQVCVLELAGSTRRCLAQAHGFASGSWGRDGSIVFSSQPPAGGPPAGLWRVPSAGGEATRLTTVDMAKGERAHLYPQILPDGRSVLYTAVSEARKDLAAVPLAGGAARAVLGNAARGRFVRSGHLVYWDEPRGRLSAMRFDADRLATAGPPVELEIELNTTGDSIVSFDVSDNGTLVYSLGGMFGADFTVELVDRRGQRTPVVEERASWGQPRVSPDGRQLLIRRSAQPDCSLWLFDFDRRSLSRLGLDGDLHSPQWLADGERFLIGRDASDGSNRQVFEQRIDGAGALERVVRTDFGSQAESVSVDGRFVAITHDDRRDRNDILILDRQSGEIRPFLASEYDEDHPAFSPDGSLVAYAANDSGRSEVYVRPFPGPGGKYAVSNHGGTGPVWSRDGREIFYAEGDKLMRVPIDRAPRFAAGSPQILFETPDFVWERVRNYDVLPDGSGFVIVRRGSGTPATRTLRAVFDWFAELERLAPAGAR
jgi:serine/threonine protein kinase/Tol biopolymer transport system component